MFRPRMLLLCLGVIIAGPAAAQVIGRPIEASGQAGWMHFDKRAIRQDAPVYGASLGWRTNPWLVAEGYLLLASANQDSLPHGKDNFTAAGADLRMDLRPAENRVVPFATVGFGYAQSHTSGHSPEKLQRGSGTLGLGMMWSLRSDARTYVRADVRSLWFKERDAFEFSDHFAITIGLHHVFGGKPHDTDLDGVPDWNDACPSTPLGATVDAKGCPKDSDGDGVLDGIDKCPDTPKGATVDARGCPKDSDGDGVPDGIDQCADTPKGATVDARGCPKDSDGDGVLDGIDQCANTPKGCTVDAKGCPSDADGDGVCDGLDLCPNTPAGLRVDEHGCPIEVNEREIELLDTGMIRLQNINFETGKATLLAESFPMLADVAHILQQYPTLRIEIGGHTDNRGKADLNAKLSGDRAAAVLDYLKQNFPQISSSQFTSKGYGPDRPIAPNSTTLGRARNRRVEFKVLNTDALRIERDKRRFLRRDEGAAKPDSLHAPAPAKAPADTTRH
ncbi:MAG: OmpA family protein [Candidatus Eisenbacteria bacterium]|uniref:OmpA family protein n=1 Tax=Eiseniibacteriota bacterium TaxID=2212470 RepID=A0A9D6QIB4_UNCEI|nr:OmpA family protein [Candidatus Eisenbacteria bacterium]MBI3539137.1 OmpA family protein [Candidatus Eisenbacteria bacterium]